MKKLKIGLSGLHGRVNSELILLAESYNCEFITSSKETSQERCQQIFSQQLDLFIDFSCEQFWPTLKKYCLQYSTPLLSGTTAILGLDEDLIKLGEHIPVIHEKNFSLGIYALKKVVKYLKGLSHDISLEEIHHQGKKDAPSGTALDLCQILNSSPDQVHVSREGQNVGTHRVKFRFDEQQIFIEHEALSRQMFATSAVKVALWLRKQKKGVYTLDQYLKEVTLCPQDTL